MFGECKRAEELKPASILKIKEEDLIAVHLYGLPFLAHHLL
jgi:hypothetical protein